MSKRIVLHVLPDSFHSLFRSLLNVALTFIIFSDLNRLVMDYLVIEGFKSAAEEFGREAGLAAPVDLDSIESRMNIREALQRGDVGEAIARVNDLNPEVSTRSNIRLFAPRREED